jgi:hypothetical protein
MAVFRRPFLARLGNGINFIVAPEGAVFCMTPDYFARTDGLNWQM